MIDIGREFLEKTKVEHLSQSDESQGILPPPLELKNQYQKIIDLPDPKALKVDINLTEAIEQRRSLRKYSDTPLTMEELSYLLWCTQGVKKVTSTVTFRNVPSAGARHAFETYLLINNVTGVEPGLYRYLAIEHKLAKISSEPGIGEKLKAACLGQEMITSSAAAFVWVAVPYRMTYRYVERGFRYLFLDAGHVCQNLYLAAEGIGAGVCAVAAYSDDAVNQVLEIDGIEKFTIYMGTVGKK